MGRFRGGPRVGGRGRGLRGARMGRRSGGGGPGRFTFSTDVPSGKWKHDKFSEVYGSDDGDSFTEGRSFGGGGGGFSRRRSAGNRSSIVKLNISNLPDSVITADLEELFQDFDVYGVTVHYDETGAHLGTADLFVGEPSSIDILKEFRGIAIDGKEMKFALIDESAAKVNIRSRLQLVRSNPIRRRKVGLRRSGGVGRRTGGASGGSGRAATNVSKLSTEDLDKELDAYMSIRNAGGK